MFFKTLHVHCTVYNKKYVFPLKYFGDLNVEDKSSVKNYLTKKPVYLSITLKHAIVIYMHNICILNEWTILYHFTVYIYLTLPLVSCTHCVQSSGVLKNIVDGWITIFSIYVLYTSYNPI